MQGPNQALRTLEVSPNNSFLLLRYRPPASSCFMHALPDRRVRASNLNNIDQDPLTTMQSQNTCLA